MILVIIPAAWKELQDIATYYESVGNAALARSFVDEFERVTTLVLTNPALGHRLGGPFRQYSFRKFPYRIIYSVAPPELRIQAIAHHRRKPGYWIGRRSG